MAAFKKTKREIWVAVAIVVSGVVLGPGTPSALGQMAPRPFEKIRFEKLDFNVNEKIPLRDLLPPAPKAVAPGPLAGNDLAAVPEVQFEEPVVINNVKPVKKLSAEEAAKRQTALAAVTRKNMLRNAHQIAKINYLNLKKRDFFMEALLENRPDLAGLPFVMGDACRLQKGERPDFKCEMNLIRGRLNDSVETGGVQRFWRDDDDHVKERLKEKVSANKERFRVAAFRQVLGQNQPELVPRLAALGKSAEKEAAQCWPKWRCSRPIGRCARLPLPPCKSFLRTRRAPSCSRGCVTLGQAWPRTAPMPSSSSSAPTSFRN